MAFISSDTRGVEPRLTDDWRGILSRVDEEMVVWARTYRKMFGAKVVLAVEPDGDEVEDADPYAASEDDAAGEGDYETAAKAGEL